MDLQEVETSFDDQGVVVELASKSFFKSGSVILLKAVDHADVIPKAPKLGMQFLKIVRKTGELSFDCTLEEGFH